MRATRIRPVFKVAAVVVAFVVLVFGYIESFVTLPWLVARGHVNFKTADRVDRILYAPLHLWCESYMPGADTLIELRHRAALDGRQ